MSEVKATILVGLIGGFSGLMWTYIFFRIFGDFREWPKSNLLIFELFIILQACCIGYGARIIKNTYFN